MGRWILFAATIYLFDQGIQALRAIAGLSISGATTTTRVRIELAQQCGEKKVEILRSTFVDATNRTVDVAATLDNENCTFEDVVYVGVEFSVREIEG
ncbi:hypothetical protein [Lysobacter enzymogenes]|uniref:hypothetical protein n=1 Tax=Lysobacter enzymogenes TaxID=69 RepID=UPI001F336340|nr:hypothetical protein [Lysobacter enzymogenes]